MKVYVVASFVLVMSACSKDSLDGPIPECPDILSEQRQAYVQEGKKLCEQARTFEEKMKSVGCVIQDKAQRCARIKNLSSGKSAFDEMRSK